MEKSSRDWTARLLFGLLALWAAVFWTRTVLAVYRNYSAIPVWDYWMTIAHLEDYRWFDLSVLWTQHNEHRVIVPELAFAADYLLFQGREILPLVLNVVCQFLTCFIFVWTLYRTSNVPRDIAIGAGLLCAVFLGWPGFALVLQSPFCLQWTFFELFAALAFVEIGQAAHSTYRLQHLSAAILCAAAASYSSANGLGVWPVLLVAAFWLRLSWREIWILAAAAAIFAGLFFVGYHRAQNAGPGVILAHPMYWFWYVGCYLSLPFSFIDNRLGVFMGWLGVAMTVFLIWRLRREDVRGETAGILYSGFCLLTLLTALLVSFARMDLHDPEFSSAKAGRYLLLPALFWASLCLAMVWLVSREKKWRTGAILLLFGFGWWMALALPRAALVPDLLSEDFRRYPLAALSLEAGLEDKSLIVPAIYPDAHYPHTLLPTMRDLRVSVFADPRFIWMGRNFQALAVTQKDKAIRGSVVTVKPVTGGVEILGWVDDESGAKEFVFLDETGRVVGLGERLAAGVPPDLKFPMPEQTHAWAGFVNLQFHSARVRLWALGANRSRLSPLGQEIALP